jgi:hypothetical protein
MSTTDPHRSMTAHEVTLAVLYILATVVLGLELLVWRPL